MKTITLRYPIEFGSQTITQITVRRVTGKDMRKLPDGNKVDIALALASRLTGQPDPVIDRLEGEDLQEVLDACGDFTQSSPPTGTES